eukprot:GHUV01024306.1.p1 GENE.GHUV01024306.1~~GHUV01024306.1.p1  ORF type:complete len:203 (+),score=21.23 GHUV01024306.1:370-978(+)
MGLHRRRVWEIAKGFRGRAKNCIKIARQQAEKSLQHAYKGRKDKRSNWRALWIQRINAASRQHGVSMCASGQAPRAQLACGSRHCLAALHLVGNCCCIRVCVPDLLTWILWLLETSQLPLLRSSADTAERVLGQYCTATAAVVSRCQPHSLHLSDFLTLSGLQSPLNITSSSTADQVLLVHQWAGTAEHPVKPQDVVRAGYL